MSWVFALKLVCAKTIRCPISFNEIIRILIGLTFLKRYAEGRTEKKARVLTCPSPYRLTEPLSCHLHTEPFGHAMRRQCDLHARESNRRPMHFPTITADPPKRDYIRFV
jgi:hypothetical protein